MSADIARRLEAMEGLQRAILLRLDASSSEEELPELHTLLLELRAAIRQRSPVDARLLIDSIRELIRGAEEAVPAPSGAASDSHHATVLASYSPAEVVFKFSHIPKPRPPSEPERDDFVAAVGFVDVSGFTKLSEKLAKEHGRKGAEMLNQYVNGTPLSSCLVCTHRA